MKKTGDHLPALLTFSIGLVLLSPVFSDGNLVNYSRISKGSLLQNSFLSGRGDTIPPREKEDFDTPFGEPKYQPESPPPPSGEEEKPSMVIPALKVDIDTSFTPALKVPAEYSGFKIEIQAVKEPLPPGHDIFFQHGRLFEGRLPDGSYSYLLGDFQTAEEASAFMQDFLITRYPKAKVAEYKEGNRLY